MLVCLSQLKAPEGKDRDYFICGPQTPAWDLTQKRHQWLNVD